MNYRELIRLSTKGDQQALDDLFALAEKLTAEKKHEEAAKVFRESAISYRISAFRNSALSESSNGKVYWLNEEIKLIKHWIQLNPSGLRPLPRKIDGLISEKIILEILKNEIWPDSQFSSLIQLLETALQNNGMEFYSPGGSSLRRILQLMETYFGINEFCGTYLDYLDVRIYIDLLANEVENRFNASKTKNLPPL